MQAGFSTAEEVTTLAGRGVGMDVVKNETASLGGRIEIDSVTGRGATFRIYLPLTLAVTQAVLVTAGNRRYAIPSSMIEQATEHKPEAAARIRAAGSTEWLGNRYPYHYLAALLGDAGSHSAAGSGGTGSCWSRAEPSASRSKSTAFPATRKSWSRPSGRNWPASPDWRGPRCWATARWC
jgi:chemotaxis protein histidine kinase CheA